MTSSTEPKTDAESQRSPSPKTEETQSSTTGAASTEAKAPTAAEVSVEIPAKAAATGEVGAIAETAAHEPAKAANVPSPPVSAALPPSFWEGMKLDVPVSRQILERMSHRFPSSGIDALGQGVRLADLVDRMLLWEAVLRGDEPFVEGLFGISSAGADPDGASAGEGAGDCESLSDERWHQLEQRWSRVLSRLSEGGEVPSDWAQYPLHLRAFCARHRALCAVGSGDFGDNDLDLELLWQPADGLLRSLERALWQWYKTQPSEEPPQSGWRRWLFWLVVAGVIGGYLFSGWGLQPRRPSDRLPKGAIAGGIQGSYYQGTQFQQLAQRRTDEGIWFHWQASPIANVTANYFSIRWSGFVRVPTQGRYKFCLHHDDGATLRVGQRALLTYWRPGKDTVHCADATLGKGWHPLVVHMFDRYGAAVAKLSWQPPGAPNPKKVPASHLCCRNL